MTGESMRKPHLFPDSRDPGTVEIKFPAQDPFTGGRFAPERVAETVRIHRLCAAHHGQELHRASLARDCGLSQPTVAAWIGVLEASYVLALLPPYHRNFGKRLIKTPKLDYVDSSLVTTTSPASRTATPPWPDPWAAPSSRAGWSARRSRPSPPGAAVPTPPPGVATTASK